MQSEIHAIRKDGGDAETAKVLPLPVSNVARTAFSPTHESSLTVVAELVSAVSSSSLRHSGTTAGFVTLNAFELGRPGRIAREFVESGA